MTAYQRMVLRLLFHLVWHVATNDGRSSRAMWNAGKDAQKMLADDTEPGEDATVMACPDCHRPNGQFVVRHMRTISGVFA